MVFWVPAPVAAVRPLLDLSILVRVLGRRDTICWLRQVMPGVRVEGFSKARYRDSPLSSYKVGLYHTAAAKENNRQILKQKSSPNFK